MLPIVQIGPFALQTPGLVLLVGIWVGLSLSERHSARFNVNPNHLYSLTLLAIIAGVVGARLAYAARFTEAFATNPVSLISLNPGLLDPAGGLVVGLIAAAVYGQRMRMAFWPTLDALTPALAVFTIALALSHLASGLAFGAQTDLPWGIELWGAKRHPSQIYEALSAALIFWLVWPGRTRASGPDTPGTTFLRFVALSAGARLFFEGFRGDSAVLVDGIRTAQVIAWLLLAGSLWGLARLRQTDGMEMRTSE